MTLCFKAYDIRGRVPDELDERLACRIGAGTAALLGPGPVVVGRHPLEQPRCCSAIKGLTASGRDVIDIGMCGTGGLFPDVPPPCRRRHHGHRQPQPDGLQRDEAGARRRQADQR